MVKATKSDSIKKRNTMKKNNIKKEIMLTNDKIEILINKAAKLYILRDGSVWLSTSCPNCTTERLYLGKRKNKNGRV